MQLILVMVGKVGGGASLGRGVWYWWGCPAKSPWSRWLCQLSYI